ncbi:hypothetical protein HU200_053536 [Digitaria exilis]|uniref:F-box protein AT5G49610-like beta-propeller domain-containing protein n=1 Tax=Digitaria exilis TaxID=1010633 RepID=A0A835AJ98_9POAL|nr:hypothetical protein HU200_053536 [Digitaria exilis]CAB3465796.1 unnamed protein product [Digitaria exilis]
MSSPSQQAPRRRRLPPTAKPQAPTDTTIHDLGDDLLLAIFLRLPSLPSLVRAAFACRSFLAAVRSSPAFRRRFRDLHPPPLLGLFFDPCGPYVPSFTPLRRQSDPDLAAAVRGADFFLTRVPATDDASPGWGVLDCRGGYLFLLNSEDEETATYNPVTRVLDLIPLPPDEIMDEVLACHGVHLISSDEAPGSFRVVYVFSNESRVRATVFSSCTREWRVLPWEEPAPEQQGWLPQGTQVNGSLYWAHKEQAYMMVLDTATLQFSSIDLPEQMKGQGHLYRVGETKDGKLCIVRVIEFDMFVWHRGPDADGADKWKLGKIFRLEEDVLKATGGSHLEHSVLKVLEIMDGIVYLFLQTSEDAHLLCWFLTLCLKTGKLDKLFRKQNDSHVHPYIMAWPPSLVSEIMNP